LIYSGLSKDIVDNLDTEEFYEAYAALVKFNEDIKGGV